ncbi:MAG: hypothetical protein COB53_01640 [Elusimicrobia bacterium]|nr:MAG: hypothetical protein COB53_01640 [Elusimicrobiota bacterium]
MAAASIKPASVRVGRTPRRKAAGSGPASLFYYAPKGRVHRAPVLMVYAMVNKPFVLDLLPGLSVVERFRDAGHPVYLVDWGTARPQDASRPLEDYVLGDLGHFMDVIAARHPGKKPTVFGYCEGGLFSLLYAAARPKTIARLILLATPVDFSKMGTLCTWSQKGQFDVDLLVRAFGNVPGSFLWSAFETLKPLSSLRGNLGFLDALYQKKLSEGQIEQFLALEAWKREFVPHPGEVFRRVVKDFYQDNKFMKSKDLKRSRFRGPALVIYGERDHLVPPAAAEAALGLLGRRAESIAFKAGHVGLSVSGRAHRELWPKVLKWLSNKEATDGLA